MSLVAGLEDLAAAFTSKDRRDELREHALVKLQERGVFEICEQGEFIRGARWLYPTTVDIEEKS